MYIKVRVQAGAKREKFSSPAEGKFEIAVTEPAERNEANKRVIKLIAAHFGVTQARVHIKNGHRTASKLLSVDVS